MKDFSGQGKVWLATRQKNGRPGALKWVDDASTLQLAMTVETSERTESYTGRRLTSAVLTKSQKATFTLTVNAFSAANLALALYGQSAVIPGGASSGEACPSGLVAGDTIALDHRDISDLVITDSDGQQLVDGTDYRLASAAGGLVTALKSSNGWTANYTYGPSVNVTLFTQGAPERYLVFDGINTVSNDRCRVQIYRLRFSPASQLDLVNDDFATLELKGSVLYDDINASDDAWGGFARFELPGE